MKIVSLLLIVALDRTQAFIAPPYQSFSTKASSLFSAEKPKVPKLQSKRISYGEESRKYRRTIYTHEDWVNHRNDRLLRNIRSIFSSGIYKNIAKELAGCVAVAVLLIFFNSLTGDYTDFAGVNHVGILAGSPFHVLELPTQLFSLSSSALGLLLVFRTNASYSRWDEARKSWGKNINHSRDLVRMASSFYEREGVPESIIKQDLDRVAMCVWAFARSMKRHLSPDWEDEIPFSKEIREKLPAKQAQKILDAEHRPNRALQDLSFAIEALPMNSLQKIEMDHAITIFEDNLGTSERLLSSPVPLVYSRLTARFSLLWSLTFPLGLYEAFADTWNHIGLIPSTAAMAAALLGIDEIATQLEEPFTILPMQAFCDKIFIGCSEIVTWQPNDNGMFSEEYLSELEAFKERQTINGIKNSEDDFYDERSRMRSLRSRSDE